MPFLIAGVLLLVPGFGPLGIYWIVLGVLFLYLYALWIAWVLLIEINR